MTGELILYLPLTAPFLPRWVEASGADAACGSCDSAGGDLSNPGRKIRDVSQRQSMLIEINCLKYLILCKEN